MSCRLMKQSMNRKKESFFYYFLVRNQKEKNDDDTLTHSFHLIICIQTHTHFGQIIDCLLVFSHIQKRDKQTCYNTLSSFIIIIMMFLFIKCSTSNKVWQLLHSWYFSHIRSLSFIHSIVNIFWWWWWW